MMKKIMLSIAVVVLSLFCFTVSKVNAITTYGNYYDFDDGIPYPVASAEWIPYYVQEDSSMEIYMNFNVINSGDEMAVYFYGSNYQVFGNEFWELYDLYIYDDSGEFDESFIQWRYFKDSSVVKTTKYNFFRLNVYDVSMIVYPPLMNTGDYDFIAITVYIHLMSATDYISIAEYDTITSSDSNFLDGIYSVCGVTNYTDYIENVQQGDITSSDLIDQYNDGYYAGVVYSAESLQNDIDEAYTDGYGDALNEGITTSWFLNMMNGVAAIFNIEVFDGVKLSFFIFFPLVIGLIGRFFWLRRGGGNG
jgi:hypothetical protein